MKTLKLLPALVIIFFLNHKLTNAQCNTGSNFPDPMANVSPVRTSGTITVRVAAHIVEEYPSCTQSTILISDVYTALDKVAQALAPFDICISLYYYDFRCYDYTNNNYFDNNFSSNAIDVYFLPVNYSCCGTTITIPDSRIAVFGTVSGSDGGGFAYSTFLVHEFGHCFGLFHTFERQPPSCPELVDGSNSLVCGDYISDTPADFGFIFRQDPLTCNINIAIPLDANGDTYAPDTRNFMEYCYTGCADHFTPGQGQKMRDVLLSMPFFNNRIIGDDVYVQNVSENLNENKLYASHGDITSGNSVTSNTVNGNVEFTDVSKVDFIATQYIDLESGFTSSPAGGQYQWLSGYFDAAIDPNYCNTTNALNSARLTNRSFSQYHPMLNNTVWLASMWSPEGFINSLWTTIADTLMNGFTYKKLDQQYINLPGIYNNPFFNGGSTIYYFREDTVSKKVYQYDRFTGDFEILDFSLQLGDTLPNPLQPGYTITTIDSINTNAGYRKRFIFTDTSSSFKIIWVEGIGNLAEPFQMSTKYDTTSTNVLCVHENGNLIYEFQSMFPVAINCGFYNDIDETNGDFIINSIYPNPSHDKLNIEFSPFDLNSKRILIYDLAGKLEIETTTDLQREIINIKNLNQGIYLIRIIENQKTSSNLFVKD